MLRCRQTDDAVGDVIEAPSAEGFWPDGRRFDIGLVDSACTGDHVHERPTQDEIAASVAEAKRLWKVIDHRVNVRR